MKSNRNAVLTLILACMLVFSGAYPSFSLSADGVVVDQQNTEAGGEQTDVTDPETDAAEADDSDAPAAEEADDQSDQDDGDAAELESVGEPVTVYEDKADPQMNSVEDADADEEEAEEEEYGLFIGGEEVTADNSSGDGWSYDRESQTLTLNNYSYSGDGTQFTQYDDNGKAAIKSDKSITVILKGESEIRTSGGGLANYGIIVNGKVSFCGNGSLTVRSGHAEGRSAESIAIRAENSYTPYEYGGRYEYGTIEARDNVRLLCMAGSSDSLSKGLEGESLVLYDNANVEAAGGQADYSYGSGAYYISIYSGSAHLKCTADRRSSVRTPISGYTIYLADGISESDVVESGLTNASEEDYFEDIAEAVDEGECGPDLKWYITKYDELVISGSGDMYDYGKGGVSAKPPWDIDKDKINSVVVLPGCTGIGDNAFADLAERYLSDVIIADSVRSIGEGAFENVIKKSPCSGFKLPDELRSIGESAFSACIGIKGTLVIPKNVTGIGEGAFEECSSITGLNAECRITNLKEFAFSHCTSLKEVTLPEGLKIISANAFRSCLGLAKVNIPETVTSIKGKAFNQCPNLTELIFAGSPPEIASNAFDGCDSNMILSYDPSLAGWTTPEWNGFRAYPVHTHDKAGVSVKPATTTEEGRIDHICSVCGIWSEREVVPKIDEESLEIGSGGTYTGKEIKPSVSICDTEGDQLVAGTDYDVSYTNNINAGTGKVLVTFKGNYYGTLSGEFTIAPKSISGMTGTLSATTYTYDGNAKSPSITVSGLTLNKDFTLAYKNNINAGTATVTVTGTGNYTGSFSKTYTIKPAAITSKTITLSATSFAYTGSVRKPTVTVSGVTTANYTVKYSNASSKNVGSYNVTVTGKSNYTGSKTLSYTIKPKATTLSSLTAGTKCFTAKWKKVSAQATGYQLQYSTSSTFASGNKTSKITSYSTVSKKISSLTAKKKYYVRIRTYKTVSSTTYYSAWSAKKAVTTK